jgi:hypothetical protein
MGEKRKKNIKYISYFYATHKTIILPVVLYGCETWFLTLLKGHRLSVLESTVLRRKFGLKRNEVTGG